MLTEQGVCDRLGSYHFLPVGGRLSVIAGRQFFLVPPFGMRQKILVPSRQAQKNLVPPWPTPKNSGPPLVKEHPLT